MIDQRKHACYIITVQFWWKKKDGSLALGKEEFVSLHSISSKRFRTFAETRLRAKYGDAYLRFHEDWGAQRTVKNEDFCN